jgi:uncharacterized protein
MVPGIKFYKEVMRLEAEYKGATGVTNLIQTNGVLINEEWIDFFKENNFWISISLDGPKHLHDTYRKDKRDRGSFDRVLTAIDKVRAAGLPLGISLVISKATKDHVEEIYDFLVERKLGFNVIPMNRSGGAREKFDQLGLEAHEYGEAWIKMYDRWFNSDEDYAYCMDFTLLTRSIMAGRAAECIGLARCADTNISVDPIGDVYACASLSGHARNIYGNILKSDLDTIMTSSRVALDYRNRRIDPQCAECKWQHVCHGGCPARAYKFHGDHHQRDYYCPSLFSMYEHIERRIGEKGFAPAAPHRGHMS